MVFVVARHCVRSSAFTLRDRRPHVALWCTTHLLHAESRRSTLAVSGYAERLLLGRRQSQELVGSCRAGFQGSSGQRALLSHHRPCFRTTVSASSSMRLIPGVGPFKGWSVPAFTADTNHLAEVSLNSTNLLCMARNASVLCVPDRCPSNMLLL